MKIIQNKWINKFIPLPNFRACNLFGVVFVRGTRPLSDVTINHESIHSQQFYEITAVGFALAILLFPLSWIFLLFAPFFYYIVYVLEWIIRLPMGDAYRSISFEKEAYDNEDYLGYLKERKPFSFLNYL